MCAKWGWKRGSDRACGAEDRCGLQRPSATRLPCAVCGQEVLPAVSPSGSARVSLHRHGVRRRRTTLLSVPTRSSQVWPGPLSLCGVVLRRASRAESGEHLGKRDESISCLLLSLTVSCAGHNGGLEVPAPGEQWRGGAEDGQQRVLQKGPGLRVRYAVEHGSCGTGRPASGSGALCGERSYRSGESGHLWLVLRRLHVAHGSVSCQ